MSNSPLRQRSSSLPEVQCHRVDVRQRVTSVSMKNAVRPCCLERRPKDTYRIVFLGGAGVGKTSIVKRIVQGAYTDKYAPTIEDLYQHTGRAGGFPVTLTLLDTSGSYTFPAMRKLSIARGDAFVLVYCIGDKTSYEEALSIYELIKQDRMEFVPIVFVGCKADLLPESEMYKNDEHDKPKVASRKEVLVSAKIKHLQVIPSPLVHRNVLELKHSEMSASSSRLSSSNLTHEDNFINSEHSLVNLSGSRSSLANTPSFPHVEVSAKENLGVQRVLPQLFQQWRFDWDEDQDKVSPDRRRTWPLLRRLFHMPRLRLSFRKKKQQKQKQKAD